MRGRGEGEGEGTSGIGQDSPMNPLCPQYLYWGGGGCASHSIVWMGPGATTEEAQGPPKDSRL